MKISKLISELKDLEIRLGDFDVLVNEFDGRSEGPIVRIMVDKKRKSISLESDTYIGSKDGVIEFD